MHILILVLYETMQESMSLFLVHGIRLFDVRTSNLITFSKFRSSLYLLINL